MFVSTMAARSRVFHRKSLLRLFSLLLIVSMSIVPASAMAATEVATPASQANREKVIFFSSDGLRQDLVEQFASQRLLPTMASLLRTGAQAADGGLLTQAPPNTGAGWYSLATGAWPGVHGSTNNTFTINGAPFGNRTAAFDSGALQAETLAQAAERGGKKVAQIE